MTEYDTGIWLFLRGPLTIFMTLILVVFFVTTQINITSEEIHADIIAAKVAYNGGFLIKPGIIDATKFGQSTADQYMQASGNQIDVPIGVGVRLLDHTCDSPLVFERDQQTTRKATGNELGNIITYNSFAFAKLGAFWDTNNRPRSVHAKEYYFPAMLRWDTDNEQPVCMNMEVVYET